MLFPSMADVVLSTSDATFGYPEIRRGVLPGFVSLSATKRLSKRQCLRWMLTGDTFDATVAKSNGFVDIILDGGRDAVRSKLMEFVANVLGVPSAIQIARKRVLASGGNHISAILESGKAILANINLQVFPTVKPGAVTLSWPDSYTAHIQFENPHGDCARSWNMVSNLANLVEELKGNRSMRAVVLYGLGSEFYSCGDPHSWIKGATCSMDTLCFEEASAILYQIVSVCTQSFRDLPVPVLAVLDGCVSGAGLAIALSADYRLATGNTQFLFQDELANGLFDIGSTVGLLVGAARWSNFLKHSSDIVLDSSDARELGLVSSVHETFASANEYTKQLCAKIEAAPARGVRNTIELLRYSHTRNDAATKSVNLARKIFTTSSLQPHFDCNQSIVRDDGSVSSIVLSKDTTIQQLHQALLECSSVGKTVLIQHTAQCDITSNSWDSPAYLNLIEWFRCERKRPLVFVMSCGNDLSLSLPLLADVRFATPSTSFCTDKFHPLVYACLAYAVGTSGCGRMIVHEGTSLSSEQARDIGIVHHLTESVAIEDIFSMQIPRRWQLPGISLAECVVNAAFQMHNTSESTAEISWNHGVACVTLRTAMNLENALEILENTEQRLNGVLIDARDSLYGHEVCSRDDFMSQVRFLSTIGGVKRRFERLGVTVCTILDGAVGALAAAVACASHLRFGSKSVQFDFADEFFAAVLFDLTVALPSILGISATESLKTRRDTLSATDALDCGLLTKVVGNFDDLAMANILEEIRRFKFLPDIDFVYSISLQEEAERILTMASRSQSELDTDERKTQSDVVVKVEDHIVHIELYCERLTSANANAILSAIQFDRSMHVFYLDGFNQASAECPNWYYVVKLVKCLESCVFPVVVVCRTSGISRDFLPIVTAADIVIASESAIKESFGENTSEFLRRGSHHRWADINEAIIVIPEERLESEVENLLSSLRKLDFSLLRTSKRYLPVSSLEAARLVMSTLRKCAKRELDLTYVRLDVTADGVAVLELNDPSRYNAETPELLAALRARVMEVDALVNEGKVKSLVLQGVGPHFCTGAWAPDQSNDFLPGFGSVDNIGSLDLVAEASEIALLIRNLPVPTFAAVHGTLVGGGLALALTVDFRVCAKDTYFNFGNLPRNMSPLFMLSRSLPFTVGWGYAMKMYLEDMLIAADSALQLGLVHSIVQCPGTAKEIASELAKTAASYSFYRSKLSKICTDDYLQYTLEIS